MHRCDACRAVVDFVMFVFCWGGAGQWSEPFLPCADYILCTMAAAAAIAAAEAAAAAAVLV